MIDLPTLADADVVAELQYIHRTRRRTRDTALYGRGAASVVHPEIDGAPTAFRVVPVSCELELRRALVGPRDTAIVALVDFDATRLPADLVARLARGAVKPVSSESRLRRRFGVSWIHPELQRLRPLCDALLTEEGRGGLPAGAAQLDLDTAWRLALARRCGLAPDVALTLRALLVHLATAHPSTRWTEWMREEPELRAPFEAWLARAVDPLAPALWTAWESGHGRAVAALTFVLGPLAPVASTSVARVQRRAWLTSIDEPLARRAMSDEPALARWAACEAGLADALASDERTLDALLREADARVRDCDDAPELRDALGASTRLAVAWDHGQRAMAAALDALRAAPGRDAFARAVAAWERLTRHRLAARDTRTPERALAALQLLGWTAARPALAHLATEGAPWQLAVEIARDHVAQGGFADLCRQRLRGSGDGPLGASLAAVEALADALRDEDDRRFARSLRAWTERGRPADEVIPIERALDLFAAPFLAKGRARRLLVILLDGASWANALEIVMDLEARHRVGVLRWQPARTAVPWVTPVMAALPTITRVSRAAFFGGKVPEPGDAPETANDPKRFAAHRALREAVPEAPPVLRLEPDVQLPSGEASPEALAMVRGERRVVGVVLNAIDDQLHGSRQVRVRYTAETIKPLLALLEAARETGRAVLLASDHGHVPGARLRSVGARTEQGEARWRVISEDAPATDDECAVAGPGVWTPRKGQRIALRASETDAFGMVSGDGQHGGACVAEVVAPTFLLAGDALASAIPELHGDAELDVRPLPRPDWWDLRWRDAPAPPTPVVSAKSDPAPRLPLAGIDLAPPKPAPPPPAPKPLPPSAFARALLEGEVFRAQPEARRRFIAQRVVPAVDLLVANGGTLGAPLFERGLQELPGRCEQLVAVISEVLNIDGYPVLTYDPASRAVHLDIASLRDLIDLGDEPL